MGELTSRQDAIQLEQQQGRVFKEIVVEYLSYSIYPEYIGKPYFSIKYMENGQELIGYGTYRLEVLSEYLKEYFMTSTYPKQTVCEYCHEDSDGYVRPIEKNSHAWLIRHGKDVKLHISLKGDHRECDILFCPMCGRRLSTDGGKGN
jgi:hypothetical protein